MKMNKPIIDNSVQSTELLVEYTIKIQGRTIYLRNISIKI